MQPTFKRAAVILVPATVISFAAAASVILLRAFAALARHGLLSGANRSDENFILDNLDVSLLFWVPLALANVFVVSRSFRDWPRMFGVSLIKGTVLFVPIFLAHVIRAWAIVNLAAATATAVSILAVIVLVPPALYALLRWVLAVPAIGAGRGVIQALRESGALTQNVRHVLTPLGSTLTGFSLLILFTPALVLLFFFRPMLFGSSFLFGLLFAVGVGFAIAKVVSTYHQRLRTVYESLAPNTPTNRSDG